MAFKKSKFLLALFVCALFILSSLGFAAAVESNVDSLPFHSRKHGPLPHPSVPLLPHPDVPLLPHPSVPVLPHPGGVLPHPIP